MSKLNNTFEKMPTTIVESSKEGAIIVAKEIVKILEKRKNQNRKAVIGFATGSTPTTVYKELIRIHQEKDFSFSNMISFNLDEYYPIEKHHAESYYRFMREQLFDHLDVPEEQINIPDGTVKKADVNAYCKAYEEKINELGGLDLQLLGIGRTGHIGFNEPGSSISSRTRMVHLDSLTRKDAARDFLGEENVPRYALTMGVGTIFEARKIVLLAWGEAKSDVISRALETEPTETLPASLLQGHPNVEIIVDESAASKLTCRKLPWLVGKVSWSKSLMRSAVTWLSKESGKPILKLVDEDYSERGLADLLTDHGPSYDLNIQIFNEIQHTLTGWPGGKPNAPDQHRPERAEPHPKRSLILAPEPLDAVIGMGGTLHRLVDQGHEVTVAYLTSGCLAVPDADAIKAAELIIDLAKFSNGNEAPETQLASITLNELLKKNDYDTDTEKVRILKGLIRRGEAKMACEVCGLPSQQVRFLDLPFYKKGKYRQFQLQDEDIELLHTLLLEFKPHQLYATGACAEPSTVQSVCFEALRKVWNKLQSLDWIKDCNVWLYRGASQEPETNEIDMAVPLSPTELANKIQGIYQHQTQRRQAPPPDRTTRDIWRQAEECDRRLAETFDRLGLSEYEAIEGFSRWFD